MNNAECTFSRPFRLEVHASPQNHGEFFRISFPVDLAISQYLQLLSQPCII